MNNLLAQNSTCFHANTLIYLYYGKGANLLTRDFFVRQLKVLEGYILICREGFRLYYGKDANLLTRDFFVRQFKVLEGYIYAERTLGCITEKDPSNHFKFLL